MHARTYVCKHGKGCVGGGRLRWNGDSLALRAAHRLKRAGKHVTSAARTHVRTHTLTHECMRVGDYKGAQEHTQAHSPRTLGALGIGIGLHGRNHDAAVPVFYVHAYLYIYAHIHHMSSA